MMAKAEEAVEKNSTEILLRLRFKLQCFVVFIFLTVVQLLHTRHFHFSSFYRREEDV